MVHVESPEEILKNSRNNWAVSQMYHLKKVRRSTKRLGLVALNIMSCNAGMSSHIFRIQPLWRSSQELLGCRIRIISFFVALYEVLCTKSSSHFYCKWKCNSSWSLWGALQQIERHNSPAYVMSAQVHPRVYFIKRHDFAGKWQLTNFWGKENYHE